MANELENERVAFLTANEGVEQVELTDPWSALEQAGATPVLVATERGTVQGFDHLDRADTFDADLSSGEADVDDFVGLVLPGGVANADRLRMDDAAVSLARAFFERGKPVAVICHGPWLLVEAGVVEDRRMTSYPSLRTDLVNAGATWVDERVVVCENGPNVLVSSRNPGDLEAFDDEVLSVFSQAAARQGAGR